MTGVPSLGLEQIGVAALLVAFAAAISIALQLKLEKLLAIAALRTVAQLLLVGYVLKYVFALRSFVPVLAIVLVMVGLAGHAALGRVKYSYRTAFLDTAVSLCVCGLLTAYVVTSLVLGIHPWYQPQYLIPLVGMILGNCLTGVSISLDQLLSDLVERRMEIEADLALGASAWEAAGEPLREVVRRGMIPTINAMLVVGIVSLPGMMTGQILAGSSPLLAVKYQIMVMFMLAGATSAGCVLVVLLAFRRVFTRRHQLDETMLLRKDISPPRR